MGSTDRSGVRSSSINGHPKRAFFPLLLRCFSGNGPISGLGPWNDWANGSSIELWQLARDWYDPTSNPTKARAVREFANSKPRGVIAPGSGSPNSGHAQQGDDVVAALLPCTDQDGCYLGALRAR